MKQCSEIDFGSLEHTKCHDRERIFKGLEYDRANNFIYSSHFKAIGTSNKGKIKWFKWL